MKWYEMEWNETPVLYVNSGRVKHLNMHKVKKKILSRV